MRALVLRSDRSLELVDRPKPEPQQDTDVIVDVRQTGICGTDRSVLVGKFDAHPGVIMGHEAIGTVSAVGSAVSEFAPDDNVVINPTLFCGTCRYCRRGRFNHCLRKAGSEVGIDRDGSYAEQIRLPERFLNHVPEGMPDDRATLIEPLCCALSNIEASGLIAGDELLVLGGGPIGALVAWAGLQAGARVTLSEADARRRELLADIFAKAGAEVAVVTPEELSEGECADVVIDAVGLLLGEAIKRVRAAGTVVTMGYNAHAVTEITPLDVLFRGLRIVGAGDYNYPMFERAVRIAAGMPLELLITHHFDLNEFSRAFDLLGTAEGAYGAMKVVLRSA